MGIDKENIIEILDSLKGVIDEQGSTLYSVYIRQTEDYIESLQSELTKVKEERERLKSKLLATQGKKITCKGAGQCDYDGSTCNENDNCGEYEPIIVDLRE